MKTTKSILLVISLILLVSLSSSLTEAYIKYDCNSNKNYYPVNNINPKVSITIWTGLENATVNNAKFFGENTTNNNETLLKKFSKEYLENKGFKTQIGRGSKANYSFNLSLNTSYEEFRFLLNATNEEGNLIQTQGGKLNFYIKHDNITPTITQPTKSYIQLIGKSLNSINFEFNEEVKSYTVSLKKEEGESEIVKTFNSEELDGDNCIENYPSSFSYNSEELKDLEDASYILNITYSDVSGNSNSNSYTLYRQETRLKATLLSNNTAYYFNPELPGYEEFYNGTLYVNKTSEFPIKLSTNKPASCYFSDSLINFTKGPTIRDGKKEKLTKKNGIHRINTTTGNTTKFEIYCEAEQTDEIIYLNELFNKPQSLLKLEHYDKDFNIEKYNPKESVTENPFNLYIETNEPGICNYSINYENQQSYTNTANFIDHSATPNISENEHLLNYQCVNRIGETKKWSKQIYGNLSYLSSIQSYSPQKTGTSQTDIEITLNGEVDECKYSKTEVNPADYDDISSENQLNQGGDPPTQMEFSYNFQNNEENYLNIYCVKDNQVSENKISIYYDKFPPKKDKIYFSTGFSQKSQYIKSLEESTLRYIFNSSLPIEEYKIKLYEGNNLTKTIYTSSSSYNLNTPNITNIRVTAIDELGKNSSGNIQVKYDNTPPQYNYKISNNKLNITCFDDKSGCGIINYGFSESFSECYAENTYNKNNQPLVKPEYISMCLEVWDKAGNPVTDKKIIGKKGNKTQENKTKDSDGDGMPDVWENKYGLDPQDPSDAELDIDNDTLTNLEEYELRKTYGNSTNPFEKDTDGDSYTDGEEIEEGTDPTDPEDFPDKEETSTGTNETSMNETTEDPYEETGNQTGGGVTSPDEDPNYLIIMAIILVLAGIGSGGYYTYKKGYLDDYLKKIGINPNHSKAGYQSTSSQRQGTTNSSSTNKSTTQAPPKSKLKDHLGKVNNFMNKKNQELEGLTGGFEAGDKSKKTKNKEDSKKEESKDSSDKVYDTSLSLGGNSADVDKEAESFEEFYKDKKKDKDSKKEDKNKK